MTKVQLALRPRMADDVGMGIKDRLKTEALRLSHLAMEQLMADEKRAMKIATAIGTMQRGRETLAKKQEELMRSLNFASKGDFKAVGKQLSGLKRRARELDAQLTTLLESSPKKKRN